MATIHTSENVAQQTKREVNNAFTSRANINMI